MSAEARLREALCGSASLGSYPDTVVDRLMVALDSSFQLLEARGLLGKVTVIAGTAPGPYSAPATALADAIEQVRARYRHDDASRWRNLAEAARQLEANLALLGDGGGPVPGGQVVPAAAKLVADLGFDSGNLGQWSNVQTRDRNGPAAGYSTYSASVRDGGPGHPTAARFEVRKGDVPGFGGGERAEVRAGSPVDVREGDERWYAWSTRFGDPGGSFPPPTGGWCIFMQWHAGSGSPPLCLEVTRAGQVAINNNRAGGYSKPVCPIDAGVWHDYALHVKFSRTPSKGLVEIWRDGARLASFTAATMASDHNYLKAGLYRSTQSATQVVWHDSLRVYRP